MVDRDQLHRDIGDAEKGEQEGREQPEALGIIAFPQVIAGSLEAIFLTENPDAVAHDAEQQAADVAARRQVTAPL